ncbi:MAG TPA: hypothetical protein VKN63_07450, partial [Afifellaceae bacterium]|nr:hypothetical protein [Afifellaceae bacterium]
MLRGWFDSTFGDSALLAQVVIAIVLLVFILAMLVWLFGRRSGNGVSSSLVRGRQPRLSVMEAAVVDDKRRLVLVRRDQIEHLVMIGGPSDIVVETNIVRGRAAGHGQQGRRSTAAQRQQAAVTGAPPAPYPSQYPAPAPAHAAQHSPQAPAAAETSHQIPPAAAAVAAASAAATAAAVLRRPTVADAAELEADTGNADDRNADDSEARPGTNGATRGISPFPGLPAGRLAPAQTPSQDSAQTGQQAAQAEPADDVSIDLPPEFADELAAELASETSVAG